MSTNLHMRTGSATHRGVYRENNEDSMIVAGQVKSLRACVCGSWRTLLFLPCPGA